MSTKITKKLDEQRNSPEMKKFKEKVNILLELASPEIEYHIVRDLAKKINLPFYKDTFGRGNRNTMTSDAIVKAYCKLCIDYYKKYRDGNFIEDFFMHLSEQQNQHLRKLSKRLSEPQKRRKDALKQGLKGVWEHPIPLKYSRSLLTDYIKSGQYAKVDAYITFIWENTYQVFLIEKWDNKLRTLGLRETMPSGWNWEDNLNNNVFQRYIDAGIPESEYL